MEGIKSILDLDASENIGLKAKDISEKLGLGDAKHRVEIWPAADKSERVKNDANGIN